MNRPGRIALAAVAWATALLSCTYAPDFQNGTLLCGSKGSCPKGYHCVAGHTCYKDGDNPNGDGGAGTGGAGTGGNVGGTGGVSGGTVTSRNDLVGTWDFSAAMLTISCSDGTSQTKTLQGPADKVDVGIGSGNGITGDFYCNWALDLTVASGKAMARLQQGQTCMSTGGCSDFTWTGRSFDFTADDSAHGALDAKIDATYKDYTDQVTLKNTGKTVCLPKATTTPATGSCTLTVKGPLVKE